MYASPSKVIRITQRLLVCRFVCGVDEKRKCLERDASVRAYRRGMHPRTAYRRALPMVILE